MQGKRLSVQHGGGERISVIDEFERKERTFLRKEIQENAVPFP